MDVNQSLVLDIDGFAAEPSRWITQEAAAFYAQAAVFCLSSHGHKSGVILGLKGLSSEGLPVLWRALPDEAATTWADHQEATEYGAMCIALVLVDGFTEYTVVERSRKGTGFDFWLSENAKSRELFPAHAAKLEISGILSGDVAAVSRRVRKKVQQARYSNRGLPSLIIVVEFGKPKAEAKRDE